MNDDVCYKVIIFVMAATYICMPSRGSWSAECGRPSSAFEPYDDGVTLDEEYHGSDSLIREYARSQSRLSAQAGGAQVYHVDAVSSGGDGSSWQRAFRTLHEALSIAVYDSEIRVAQGVYKPGPGIYRSLTFRLKNGVAIKGGYAGRNAVNPNARDTEAFPSILSGDLLGNDGPGFANNQDNCYHVVTGSGTNQTAALDGFTVTGGNANGAFPGNCGGGMLNLGGQPTVSNCIFTENWANYGGGMRNRSGCAATVSHCVFVRNQAEYGAGMHNQDSSPAISHCHFRENSTLEDGLGGGMENKDNSDPAVSHCTFTGNSASWGGGMYNTGSSPTVSDCTFTSNSAAPENSGGGMDNRESSPTVSGCTFTGNSAGWGGGMANRENSRPIVSHSTFRENSAADESGGGIYNLRSNSTVSDCVLTGNTASYGGGLACDECSPAVTGCMFMANSATAYGGGLHNQDQGSPVIVNCVFSGNSAEKKGGGMQNHDSDPVLTNCTFAGNWAGEDGGGVRTYKITYGSPKLANCIFWGNSDNGGRDESAQLCGGTPIVNYCCVEGLSGALGGMGNIGSDPLFVDVDGPDDTAGTEDDDLTLVADSPCIDAGDNLAVPADIVSDAQGMTRFLDDPGTADTGNGTPPIVDMGAFEFQDKSRSVVDAGTLYVDQSASGDQRGASWEHAFHGLQAALAVAPPESEIRVAQGVYKPDENPDDPLGTGDRWATFQLKNGVTIKGGYAGASAPDPDARDVKRYETVLSGDLNGDDGPEFVNSGENSYHVVTASETDATAVLDGVVITGGNANGLEEDSVGAGIYNSDGSTTLIDCTFRANRAMSEGGGMHNQGDVTLHGCTFRGNTAMFGGGMFSQESAPKLVNCTYSGNEAMIEGAGIYDDSGNPELVNCVFCANTTNGKGGGMLSAGTTSPFLINCTFYANSADFGGGAVWASSYATLVNCIVWDDSSTGEGQVFGDDVAVMYSDIQGSEWAGAHNIHLDPLFVDPDGLDDVLGTEDDNLRLQSGSPCIDAGRNAWIPAGINTDLDRKPRISNGLVDLGAYEFNGP